jgi:hypothetical protein
MELLRRNGFVELNTANEPDERVRENQEGFIELKGRGCWHQIDCPCDYRRLIPFSYPLRLLGEVKFYKTPLEKKYVREYIGVIKDIQENYFVADGVNPEDFYPRKMEVGVYFSANGFQAESEKLAYAHGIKTVSYANNYIINRLKHLIEELESNYISVRCMSRGQWMAYRRTFIDAIRYGYQANNNYTNLYLNAGYPAVLSELSHELEEIRSSFIATTATGVFLHFVGNRPFPDEMFKYTDVGRCRVYYDYDYFGGRFFWMEINDDKSKFYFTPPTSLDYASVFGSEIVLNEKERLFSVLNVNINLYGIARSLILHLDQDWLDAVRNMNIE